MPAALFARIIRYLRYLLLLVIIKISTSAAKRYSRFCSVVYQFCSNPVIKSSERMGVEFFISAMHRRDNAPPQFSGGLSACGDSPAQRPIRGAESKIDKQQSKIENIISQKELIF
ncbi:hypothetical protein LJB99_01480 [Deltaproteobacteria bacterium OttesenSCG-928-K17]|nr:hypothetical protein [Deltaproteobacteria bacterium OttesenSCG-928-K17]